MEKRKKRLWHTVLCCLLACSMLLSAAVPAETVLASSGATADILMTDLALNDSWVKGELGDDGSEFGSRGSQWYKFSVSSPGWLKLTIQTFASIKCSYGNMKLEEGGTIFNRIYGSSQDPIVRTYSRYLNKGEYFFNVSGYHGSTDGR